MAHGVSPAGSGQGQGRIRCDPMWQDPGFGDQVLPPEVLQALDRTPGARAGGGGDSGRQRRWGKGPGSRRTGRFESAWIRGRPPAPQVHTERGRAAAGQTGGAGDGRSPLLGGGEERGGAGRLTAPARRKTPGSPGGTKPTEPTEGLGWAQVSQDRPHSPSCPWEVHPSDTALLSLLLQLCLFQNFL